MQQDWTVKMQETEGSANGQGLESGDRGDHRQCCMTLELCRGAGTASSIQVLSHHLPGRHMAYNIRMRTGLQARIKQGNGTE